MVSALDSGASGPGSSPGQGHCVVFLGKTLYSQGGVEILLVASCYGNWDKLRPGGPHWPVCRLNCGEVKIGSVSQSQSMH